MHRAVSLWSSLALVPMVITKPRRRNHSKGGAVATRRLSFDVLESRELLSGSYSMIDLGTLGGTSSWAYGINDSGQVVGAANTASGAKHAFLYSNGTMTDLGTLGGNTSEVTAINNNGQVVGWANTANGRAHAFLYSNGTMTDLGTLGGSNSYAYGINDSGQVVGTYSSGGGSYGFLYSNGTMTPMGSVGKGVEPTPVKVEV